MSEKKPILWNWQHILPIVLLLFTSLWGVYIGYVNKDRKRVDLALLSESVIADLKQRTSPDLKLSYKNNEITNASIVSYIIINSGNVHLVPIDQTNLTNIKNPHFKLTFDKSVKILSVHISPYNEDHSTSIDRISSPEQYSAAFRINLFNAGAEARVDLVLADYDKNQNVLFHATGLGVKGRIIASNRRPHLVWWQVVVLVITAIGITFLCRPIIRAFVKSVISQAPWISLPIIYLLNNFMEGRIVQLSYKEKDHQILTLSIVLYIMLFFGIALGIRFSIDYLYLTL